MLDSSHPARAHISKFYPAVPREGWREFIQKIPIQDLLAHMAQVCTGTRFGTTRANGMHTTAHFFLWALQGFPTRQLDSLCRSARCTLGLWLQHGSGNKDAWNTFYGLGVIHTLHFMVENAEKKSYVRVILRAAKPALQTCILARCFRFQFWHKYITQLHHLLWCPQDSVANSALLYVALSTESGQWYIGKAQATRLRNRVLWHGGLARYKEHYETTYRRMGGQVHRPRYKSWSSDAWWSFCALPISSGSTEHILRYESLVIEVLQPPTQKTRKEYTPREGSRQRDFPRFRKKYTVSSEIALNLICKIRYDSDFRARFFRQSYSWRALLTSLDNKYSLKPRDIERLLYNRGYEAWLAIYLSEYKHRLDYKRAWRHAHVAEYI
eukprot:1190558-Pyramimonas_sp.AAC.1